MKTFILERRNDVPLEFEGWCLTEPEAATHHSALIQVFRTKSNRYVLYVGNYGHGGSNFRQVKQAHIDADTMTRQAIISACGGFDYAEKALLALKKPIKEVI